MAITGGYVNDLHLMQGTTSDLDENGKPKVTETSENTFFLVEDSGDVFYFSGGSWAAADDDVAGIVAALLNKGALPAVTSTDNGKVLGVNNGVWAAVNDTSGTKTVTVTGATPSIEAEDNTIYECGEVTSLTVSDFPETGEFVIVFTSGGTAATLSMAEGIVMPDDFAVETNTRYEISVRKGYAVAASWAVTASA